MLYIYWFIFSRVIFYFYKNKLFKNVKETRYLFLLPIFGDMIIFANIANILKLKYNLSYETEEYIGIIMYIIFVIANIFML